MARKRKAGRVASPSICSSLLGEDPALADLKARIASEVETLERLEAAIDEDDTDNDQPVAARLGAHEEDEGVAASARDPNGHASRQLDMPPLSDDHVPDDNHTLKMRLKHARDGARKKRKKDHSGFDLGDVNDRLSLFVANSNGDTSIELPNYSKTQRMQVRAVAALYGLEARACGRIGQTLFKTDKTGPLTEDGHAQMERLLACSISHGRPTAELNLEMDRAVRAGRASLNRRIPSSNRGSMLLRQMGWAEGSGLGAQRQGRTEPVPLHLGQRRQGLGAS